MTKKIENIEHRRHMIGDIAAASDTDDFDIERYDQLLSVIHHELSDLSEVFRVSKKHSININFSLDFDVIRSALDWSEDNNKGSIWSSIILNQRNFSFYVLPGSLSELINFISYNRRESSRRNISPLSSQFIKIMSGSNESNNGDIHSNYQSSLRELISLSLRPRAYFLLNKLKNQLLPIPNVSKTESLSLYFNRFFEFLSSLPDRASLSKNNRSDAINCAVLREFNDANEGEKCILISDTNAVHTLGETWGEAFRTEPKRYSSVWSSRKSAMYMLLLQKEGSTSGAERELWKIIQEITQLRAQIRSININETEESIFSAAGLVTPSNELLNALTSFEELYEYMRNDFLKASDIYIDEDTNYNLHNQEKFYKEFQNYLHEEVNVDSYSEIMKLQNQHRDVIRNIEMTEYGASVDFGYLRRLEYKLNGTLVCSAMEFSDRVLWVVESTAPVVEFLEAVNFVRRAIVMYIGKQALDIESPENKTFNVTIRKKGLFETTQHNFSGKKIVLSAYSETKKPNNNNVSVDENNIYQIFDDKDEANEVSDLNFLRIDSELFSASFEGRYKLISMDKRIANLANQFVKELVRPEASSFDYEIVMPIKMKVE